MLFVGIGDSYQTYYQAIRRVWRYGQERPVRVWIVLSDLEHVVYENVLRKERDAADLSRELIRNVAAFERQEIGAAEARPDPYEARRPLHLPAWLTTLATQEEATCA